MFCNLSCILSDGFLNDLIIITVVQGGRGWMEPPPPGVFDMLQYVEMIFTSS